MIRDMFNFINIYVMNANIYVRLSMNRGKNNTRRFPPLRALNGLKERLEENWE